MPLYIKKNRIKIYSNILIHSNINIMIVAIQSDIPTLNLNYDGNPESNKRFNWKINFDFIYLKANVLPTVHRNPIEVEVLIIAWPKFFDLNFKECVYSHFINFTHVTIQSKNSLPFLS